MGKKKDVSEWLASENYEWAMQYIRDKAKTEDLRRIIYRHNEKPSEVEFSPKSTLLKPVKLKSSSSELKALTNTIRELEDNIQGREIISGLKNSLRQKKYRSPKNGKTPKTFTLPNSIFRKLQNIAKENRKTHTEVITKLLDNTELINEKLQGQIKDLKEELCREKEARVFETTAQQYKIDAAIKQLEINLQRLAIWETAHGHELPTHPDMTTVRQLTEKKMKEAIFSIRYAGQESLFNE